MQLRVISVTVIFEAISFYIRPHVHSTYKRGQEQTPEEHHRWVSPFEIWTDWKPQFEHDQWCKMWATQEVFHDPNESHSRFNRMSKSTVSNAALTSNRPRSETCPQLRAIQRSEYTFIKALSVEWNLLYALCVTGRASFASRNRSSDCRQHAQVASRRMLGWIPVDYSFDLLWRWRDNGGFLWCR